jgi:hypothetical protein
MATITKLTSSKGKPQQSIPETSEKIILSKSAYEKTKNYYEEEYENILKDHCKIRAKNLLEEKKNEACKEKIVKLEDTIQRKDREIESLIKQVEKNNKSNHDVKEDYKKRVKYHEFKKKEEDEIVNKIYKEEFEKELITFRKQLGLE